MCFVVVVVVVVVVVFTFIKDDSSRCYLCTFQFT